MMLQMTDAGFALLKEFEGCKLAAYRCPAGVLTIGYGHTGPDVKPKQTITRARADELLHEDVGAFMAGVANLLGDSARRTTHSQFSAMVCLAYNIGLGNFKTSSVLRLHKEGKTREAAGCFKLWDKAGGKVLAGLVRRRAAGAALYAAD